MISASQLVRSIIGGRKKEKLDLRYVSRPVL
jgi:hypothetical protein